METHLRITVKLNKLYIIWIRRTMKKLEAKKNQFNCPSVSQVCFKMWKFATCLSSYGATSLCNKLILFISSHKTPCITMVVVSCEQLICSCVTLSYLVTIFSLCVVKAKCLLQLLTCPHFHYFFFKMKSVFFWSLFFLTKSWWCPLLLYFNVLFPT